MAGLFLFVLLAVLWISAALEYLARIIIQEEWK